jgi:hypothetical protein
MFNRLNSAPPAFGKVPKHPELRKQQTHAAEADFVTPMKSRDEWDKKRLARKKINHNLVNSKK